MNKRQRKKGQIILVFAVMILGLMFLALVNTDVFLSTRGKARLQNAGDAAALAAARWQGITLNALGALNLAQVDVACKYADCPEFARDILPGIQNLQERIVFAGPVTALYAAQVIARANDVKSDGEMTRLVNDAIANAATFASSTPGWPTKGEDYAGMLRAATEGGVASGCENAQYYNYASSAGHPLYSKPFYYAVEGEDWCWFFVRDEMMNILANFNGWGEIPPGSAQSPQNPEFYSCGVTRHHGAISLADPDGDAARMRRNILDAADRANCINVTEDAIHRSGLMTNAVDFVWCLYGADWRPWREMHKGGRERLPLRSDVQPRYDVFGASAATRVVAKLTPYTPNTEERENVWTAAAKPFGEIDGRTVTLEGEFPLITPAFTAVRLIMLAGASEERLNMADAEWVNHTRDHLNACAEEHFSDGCKYCGILKKWNDPDFHTRGVEWLSVNSHQCRMPGGGPGETGGTRHAR